jgi:hypothetical protein
MLPIPQSRKRDVRRCLAGAEVPFRDGMDPARIRILLVGIANQGENP